MKRYTVYVERDVAIEAMNDREAAQIADYFHSTLDATVKGLRSTVELVASHTTCHRGEANKMVYDSQDEDVA